MMVMTVVTMMMMMMPLMTVTLLLSLLLLLPLVLHVALEVGDGGGSSSRNSRYRSRRSRSVDCDTVADAAVPSVPSVIIIVRHLIVVEEGGPMVNSKYFGGSVVVESIHLYAQSTCKNEDKVVYPKAQLPLFSTVESCLSHPKVVYPIHTESCLSQTAKVVYPIQKLFIPDRQKLFTPNPIHLKEPR